MDETRAKILMLVEGAKTDAVLMNQVLKLYGISDSHQIVSYNTNIYSLYDSLFAGGDPNVLDLLQVLKENEKDEDKRTIFDSLFSDILLVFDLDPQDARYSREKIQQMLEYFNESSDNGKLYINYPMVESFYHMRSIPDPDYDSYTVTLEELKKKTYKSRVQRENRNHDYKKFANSIEECDQVILQNLRKAFLIVNNSRSDIYEKIEHMVDFVEVFSAQANKMDLEQCLYVLCTCIFYIFDYNPRLIYREDDNEADLKK